MSNCLAYIALLGITNMNQEHQGDALLLIDFDVDWSLLDDDWDFG
jgi:hypothetical protein